MQRGHSKLPAAVSGPTPTAEDSSSSPGSQWCLCVSVRDIFVLQLKTTFPISSDWNFSYGSVPIFTHPGRLRDILILGKGLSSSGNTSGHLKTDSGSELPVGAISQLDESRDLARCNH